MQKIRIRSPQKKQKQATSSLNSSPKKKIDHKKQIEATLNELHRLQAQIYQMKIPQNPHSNGPIKKQIKQLSYLYENLTKPKQKNSLNISLKDIQNSLNIINNGTSAISPQKVSKIKPKNQQSQAVQIDLLKMINKPKKYNPTNKQQQDIQINSKTLKNLVGRIFGHDLDISLLSQTKSSKAQSISAQQIQKFINYNPYDNFDPLWQTYQMLMTQNNKFDFKKYNQINQLLSLPKVKDLSILKAAIGIQEGEQFTFQKFKAIMQIGIDQL